MFCEWNAYLKTFVELGYHNLNLGIATKAKGSQGCGPRRVWEWRFTLLNELSFWKLVSRWTPEFSKSNYKGQNTSHWKVLYIIGKLLKCRCLKWACVTRLDICNTSYGQKKGRESNWQFDSQSQKVGNWPDFRACRWSAIHRWKDLDESYNFALTSSRLEVLARSYSLAKL